MHKRQGNGLTRQKQDQNGQSLIEVMIATAILATVVLSTNAIITNLHTQSVKIESGADCTNVAHSFLSDFDKQDNSTTIYNYQPSANTPPNAIYQGAPNPFRLPLAYMPGGSFGNYQNIESATTRAIQIYNRLRALVCDDNNPQVEADLQPEMLSDQWTVRALNSMRAQGLFVRIHMDAINQATGNGVLGCANILAIRPPTEVPAPTDNYAVHFKVHAPYMSRVNGINTPVYCAPVETDFRYERDVKPPVAVVVSPPTGQDVGGAAIPLMAPVNTFCEQNNLNVNVTFPVVADEAGSIFLCSQDGVSFVNCNGFTPFVVAGAPAAAPPAQVTITGANPTTTSNTPAQIYFPNLDEAKYRFYVRSVDTAGHLSPVTGPIDWVVDRTRPTWTSAITNVPPIVDTAPNMPTGSLWNDMPGSGSGPGMWGYPQWAAAFPANKIYQCDRTLAPQFQGSASTRIGNETCDGVTDDGRPATGTVDSNGLCTLTVTPPITNGPRILTATIRDVCNPPPAVVAAAGVATTNWIVDDVNPANAIVPPASQIPGVHAAFPAYGPGWQVVATRPAPFSNSDVVWEVPTLAGGITTTLSGTTISRGVWFIPGTAGAPLNVTSATLSWQTDDTGCDFVGPDPNPANGITTSGFCAMPGYPCGHRALYNPLTTFTYYSKLQQDCSSVPCQAGLSCNLALNKCVAQNACDNWKCSTNEDCAAPSGTSNGNCVGFSQPPPVGPGYQFNSGTCRPGTGRYCTADGDCISDAGIGRCLAGRCGCSDTKPWGYYPALGSARTRGCPNLGFNVRLSIPMSTTPAPTCTHPPGDGACVCPGNGTGRCPTQTVADSCGNDVCRGRDYSACGGGLIISLVKADAQPDPMTIWLGKGSQTLPNTATGGIPPYIMECSLDGGAFQSCTSSSWPESPMSLGGAYHTYRVKATDTRGDWDISPSFNYQLDRTDPTWSLTPALASTSCGDVTSPTLGSAVDVNFGTQDNLSKVTITFTNTTTGFTYSCGPNQASGPNACTSMSVAVQGQSGVSSPNLITVTATDQAGNFRTATVPAYAAVNSGIADRLSELGGQQIWPSTGFWSRQGNGVGTAIPPYSNTLVQQFVGGNSLNFVANMRMHNCSDPITACSSVGSYGPIAGKTGNTYTSYAKVLTGDKWDSSGTYIGGPYKFSGDGDRQEFFELVDACGNKVVLAPGTAYLDWKAPDVTVPDTNNVPSDQLVFSAADPNPVYANPPPLPRTTWSSSGIASFSASCSGLNCFGSNPVTCKGLVAGNTYNCSFSATDRAGNTTSGNPRYIMPACTATCASLASQYCSNDPYSACGVNCLGQGTKTDSAPPGYTCGTYKGQCTGATYGSACSTGKPAPTGQCQCPGPASNYCPSQELIGVPVPGAPPGTDCSNTSCGFGSKTPSCTAYASQIASTCNGQPVSGSGPADPNSCQTCKGTMVGTCDCGGTSCSCDQWISTNFDDTTRADSCGTSHTGKRTDYCPVTPGSLPTSYSFCDLSGSDPLRCRIQDTHCSTQCMLFCAKGATCSVDCFSGDGTCFAAGTMVDTPKGPRRIEDLRGGDEVYAYDERSRSVTIGIIAKTFVHETTELGQVWLQNGKNFQVTKEHRFLSAKTMAWVHAVDLRPGDLLLQRAGDGRMQEVPVELVDFTSTRSAQVYNFHVKGYQTYFVDGILVHNIKDRTP